MESKKRVFVGLDPGKKGGIVCIDSDSNILSYHTLPVIGLQYDLNAINKIIQFYSNTYEASFAVENVGVIMVGTKATNASTHFCKGFLTGMVLGTGCSWQNPTPQIWQKEVWSASDKVMKLKKGNKKPTVDTKPTSLLCSKRLWPNESFLATKRSSVAHDGLIDAALIAEWLRRKFK